MALFCFWYRRECSHYAVLGEPIPNGSALKTHMAGCTGCRAYFSSLSLLTSDLDRLIAVPHPTPQFVAPVWERVRPPSRGFRWGGASMAAAAACGLLCGWTVWKMTAHEPAKPGNEVAGIRPMKMPDEGTVAAPPIWPNLAAPADGGPGRTIQRQPQHRVYAGLNGGRHRWNRSRPRIRRQYAEVTPVLNEAAVARSWQESGALYEAEGNPGLANAAYHAAYQAQPTEQAAFDMGRSAEEFGDMDQALNAYASLLDAADNRSRVEKGLNP